MKKPKIKKLAEFDSWEMLPNLGKGGEPRIQIGQYKFKSRSLRYRTFKQSLMCVGCGRIGNVLILEQPPNAISPHMNLYARDLDGFDMLMTKDHIVPKSKGGLDELHNMQTMCEKCNSRKGSNYYEPKYIPAYDVMQPPVWKNVKD